MDENDVVKFDEFLERVWGIKPPKQAEYEYQEEELTNTPKIEEKTVETAANPVRPDSEQKNIELNSKLTNQSINRSTSNAVNNVTNNTVNKTTNNEATDVANTQKITSKNSIKQMNMRRQAAEAARRATQGVNGAKPQPKPSADGVSSILNGIELNDKEDDKK